MNAPTARVATPAEWKPFEIPWKRHERNPVIAAKGLNRVVADPTTLHKSRTPDGRFHVAFVFTSWMRVHKYRSTDGVQWERVGRVGKGIRPSVFDEVDPVTQERTYYLVTEKVRQSVPVMIFRNLFQRSFTYDSELQIQHSKDLVHWSRPRTFMRPDTSLPWHDGRIGNARIVKHQGRYHLYFSTGHVQTSDGFPEPPYVGLLVADSLEGPWRRVEELGDGPMLGPGGTYAGGEIVGAGSMTVLPPGEIPVGALRRKWRGFQNVIRQLPNGKSESLMRELVSDNGITWVAAPEPFIRPPRDQSWEGSNHYATSKPFIEVRGGKVVGAAYWNAREGKHLAKGPPWSIKVIRSKLATESIGRLTFELPAAE